MSGAVMFFLWVPWGFLLLMAGLQQYDDHGDKLLLLLWAVAAVASLGWLLWHYWLAMLILAPVVAFYTWVHRRATRREQQRPHYGYHRRRNRR